MLKRHFSFYNQEQSQLQSELLNIESQCAMLRKESKNDNKELKNFNEKIDKVMSNIFITEWHMAWF